MATPIWPLVGRDDELDRLRRVVSSSDQAGVVIAGPAGVGKTRLASECLDLAAGRGFAVTRALASDSAGAIPLGALSALLPALGEDCPPAELLLGARAAIARRRGQAGLALLVDDAHRLDDVSATLVAQLAIEREAFVILTLRSEERVPDAILSLWKDEIVERIDLRPMPTSSVEELLRTVTGGDVDGGTVRRFTQASGGNPLYLRELVLAALRSELLRAENRIWRLAGPLPVSSRLLEIIEARFGKLEPPERDALAFIACGEPLGIGLLEERFGTAALDRLEDAGLLTISRNGRRVEAALAHPLYGEVLRARLTAIRAREIHRSLADLLAGTRRRSDALRLGTSQLEAGGPYDPAVLLAAAHAARAHWDLALAQRLAEAASARSTGYEARFLIAQLLLLQGRPAEAEGELASLGAVARTDCGRVAVATTRIDNFAVAMARPDEALRVAAETEALVTNVDARHELAAKRAELLYLAGQPAAALEVLQPLLEHGNRRTVAVAASVAAMSLVFVGRFDEAIDVTERGRVAYLAHRGVPLTFGPHAFSVVRAVALGHAGLLGEALALARTGYEKAITEGSLDARGMFLELLSSLSLLAGRPASAQRYAAEAAGLYRELGWAQRLRSALGRLAHSLALLGAPQEAEGVLAELDTLAIPATGVAASLILQARAWVAIAAGDLDLGADHLLEAVEVAASSGAHADEIPPLHDLARIGRAASVSDRLGDLAKTVEGESVRVRAIYAAALVGGDANGLEEASSRFAAMGMNLFAAEAAAGAAVALHRAGRPRRAAEVERRVVLLLRSCEAGVTPAVANIDAQVTLSPQELKVAGLAAAGMANKDIAGHLWVSVRTVESQLQRVYEKLGVHRRVDLSHALAL